MLPRPADHKLFLYGTLMRGEYNNSLLGDDAQFVEEATTPPGWKLLSHGGFPAMVQDSEWDGGVRGELWLVPDARIPRLDRLEGHPTFYKRTLIAVDGANRTMVSAYIYQRERHSLRVMTSGDWRRKEER